MTFDRSDSNRKIESNPNTHDGPAINFNDVMERHQGLAVAKQSFSPVKDGQLHFGSPEELQTIFGNNFSINSAKTGENSAKSKSNLASQGKYKLGEYEYPPIGAIPQPTPPSSKDVFKDMDTNNDKGVDYREWNKAFRKADANRDGNLDEDEAKLAFGDSTETSNAFEKIDTNGNRKISRNEWSNAFRKTESRKDKDNVLGRDEFGGLFGKPNETPPQPPPTTSEDVFKGMDSNEDNGIDTAEWNNAFGRADSNHDDELTYEEAKRAFGNSTDTTNAFKKIDSDGNLKITRAEWSRAFEKTESPKDNDKKLGRDEFAGLFGKSSSVPPGDGTPPQPPPPSSKDVFKDMDTNNDKGVDHGEWNKSFRKADADRDGNLDEAEAKLAFGDSAETANAFKKIDTNGNRKISRNEWSNAFSKTESRKDKDNVLGRDEFGGLFGKA